MELLRVWSNPLLPWLRVPFDAVLVPAKLSSMSPIDARKFFSIGEEYKQMIIVK